MKRNAAPVLILALLGALIAFAKYVVVDCDDSVDFANYKTYSWIGVKVGDPLWVEHVTRTIDAELVAKGWTRVDAGGDAGITAFGSTRAIPTLTTFYDGLGGRWFLAWIWRDRDRAGGPRGDSGSRHLRRAQNETDLAWTRPGCSLRETRRGREET
jgi:hypothetical protein